MRGAMPLQRWIREERGAALPEFALLLPILLAMLMGSYDLGRALTINQKVISSSQIIADLITRNPSIDAQMLDDIILAGQMALDPFSREAMGYDIVSIQFDEDNDPFTLWRVTDNMSGNDDVFSRADGLGVENEGVVAVTVSYIYQPFFTAFLRDEIRMEEIAMLRGRRSSVVYCDDC